MYLPRSLLSTLYLHLQQSHHPLSPSVLILVALEPDALAACRIFTNLLRRDYIQHKIQPIAGYKDLEAVGHDVIKPMMESQGGGGGVVVCLGVGGMIDLGEQLGIDTDETGSYSGIEVWVIDSRRPWNLGNVFAGMPITTEIDETGEEMVIPQPGIDGGKIQRGYKPGKGGIVVFDDGDIEEDLNAERDAFLALLDMPEVDEDEGSDGSDSEDEDEEDDSVAKAANPERKRKSWSDRDEEEDSSDDDRPAQRRKSNSSSPIPDSPSRPGGRGLLSVNGLPAMSRSVSPSPAQPPKTPSPRTLRRRLAKLRRKHEAVLASYYNMGSSYSEPISSMMYSLASELGREDNDLLWMAIVGVTSTELAGKTSSGLSIRNLKASNSGWLGTRGERIRQLLQDEVRRLNPPELSDSSFTSNRSLTPENSGIIPTTARSPTDTSIRLSPEPKLLLIRHWSLYDSMLHSPYLSVAMRLWTEKGKKKLHAFLAKMGVSLVQCKQSYTHMDMDLKRALRAKMLQYEGQYSLESLVPATDTDERGGSKEGWGFVRSWGWRATLSAQDVGVVVGAILEVGKSVPTTLDNGSGRDRREIQEIIDADGSVEKAEWVGRFWDAYDALEKVEELKIALPIAQHLHRAILRTGSAIIEKKQVQPLRAFRMCVVKEGPDVALFTNPSALTKLALWIGEAIQQEDLSRKGRLAFGGRGAPMVVASLHEARGVYVIVGTGGGGGIGGFADREATRARKTKRDAKAKAKEVKRAAKVKIREDKRAARRAAAEENGEDDDEEEEEEEDDDTEDDSESDDDDDDANKATNFGRNKFGNAFQEVSEETNAQMRIDSFDSCVVEIQKEDLTAFLELLSMKAVVG